ncbi:MAG: two-component sensor histidine kinase [Gammaproteobacteria bacterium]|nr:two-component sensor histidine kinase [Gammaproteobacteria bacterium]
MKRTTISFALARFVFVSYLALAVVTTVIVVNQVINSISEQQEQLLEREMATIASNYQQFLANRLIILTEQSNYPIVVQSLMQPENNQGKIQDLMSDFRFLGQRYSQSLLDFEGSYIHATSSAVTFHHHNAPWLSPLLNEKASSYIGIKEVDQQFFWVLAVAVLYHDGVEGVLTATIPIDRIHQLEPSQQAGLSIELLEGPHVIARFGQQRQGLVRTNPWPELGLSLRFTFDDRAINEGINNLVLQLSLLIILSTFVATLFAYFFGYRQLVKPILELSQATDNLEYGKEAQQLQSDVKITELADLLDKFNHMTLKVLKRERALKLSYEQLAHTNDELKHSESQRVQSEKMASIGVLAAGVAHEINNPIGFVKSNVEILKNYSEDLQRYHQQIQQDVITEQQQPSLAKLIVQYDIEYISQDIGPLIDSTMSGIERVAEIVQSLKTFARQDSPDKVLSDINEGLKATINMANNEIKYHCDLTIDLAPLPLIMVYPGKLNQVFMNLIINASQAITDHGDITIRSFIDEDYAVVEITDTGSGIEPDKFSQIFTPFYTSKPIGQGTGLGLSISHGIMEQHGGKIEVTSTVGLGSCFSIFIPLSP